MNQRNAAMGLASLGRGSDSSLVHMSPREIQALQQLAVQHGGSLTINPETGLPEAGFLSNLLPAIVGVGLAGVTGGASLGVLGKMTALKAGLLMGGGALAASGGDWRKAAKWGLGGYGGAALGSGLAGVGAAPPATVAGGGPHPIVGPVLPTQPTGSNMWKGVTNLGSKGAGAKFAAGVEAASPFGLGVKTAGLAALAPGYLQEPEALAEVDVPGTEEVAYPAYAPLNRQASAPRNLPLAVNNPYGLEDSSEQDFFSEPNYRAYDPNIDPYNAFYQPGVATAAQGGIVSPIVDALEQEGRVVDRGEQDYFTASRPTIDYTKVSPSRAVPNQYVTEANKYLLDYNQTGGKSGYYTPKFFTNNPTFGGGNTIPLRTFAQPTGPSADSGERSYFNYAAGGLTAGPGDGMSDDIMTTIAGRQRAALSPGEFVVPADVVSGIGNGDTNSGAKRLYAMMDDIRDRRTGQTAQPQRINPRLPA
jgi:hypothetical protein